MHRWPGMGHHCIDHQGIVIPNNCCLTSTHVLVSSQIQLMARASTKCRRHVFPPCLDLCSSHVSSYTHVSKIRDTLPTCAGFN